MGSGGRFVVHRSKARRRVVDPTLQRAQDGADQLLPITVPGDMRETTRVAIHKFAWARPGEHCICTLIDVGSVVGFRICARSGFSEIISARPTLLAESLGMPAPWVIISATWYKVVTALARAHRPLAQRASPTMAHDEWPAGSA